MATEQYIAGDNVNIQKRFTRERHATHTLDTVDCQHGQVAYTWAIVLWCCINEKTWSWRHPTKDADDDDDDDDENNGLVD